MYVKLSPKKRVRFTTSVNWNVYINGYQPTQKCLKDHKNKKLELDDILHDPKNQCCIDRKGQTNERNKQNRYRMRISTGDNFG
jgi:hypothetical protein